MTKKFEYRDIDGKRKEAETYTASEFVQISSPLSPIMTGPTGTIHPSLLPSSSIAKAASLVITRKAAITIQKGELVRASSPGYVTLADPTLGYSEASVLGIANTSGNANDDIEIMLLGVFADASLSIFPVDSPLFLDDMGGITDERPEKPSKNYLVDIGKSLGGGEILLFIQKPLVLGA